MSINKYVIPLHMFILSPLFPSFLALVLMIIYKIYFDPLILCDSGCSPLLLEQLKQNLCQEMERNINISINIGELGQTVQETINTEGGLTPTQSGYNDHLKLNY
jgi:hypothetical protein